MDFVRNVTRQFQTGREAVLYVEGRSGTVVVEGQETERVTIQVTAYLSEDSSEAADAALERILEGMSHQGNTVRVVTPEYGGARFGFVFGHGRRVDYTITVPRLTECRISSTSGRVEVTRIIGPLDIGQRSGKVSVRDIGADVTIATRSGATDVEGTGGRLSVSAHSGKVTVRDVRGDVHVSSHSGAVHIEQVGGMVEAQAHSGSISISRVEGAVKAGAASGRIHATEIGGPARLDARSGSVVLSEPGAGARLRTASGSITVRGALRGDFDIHAASGSVRLEVDPDSPFFLDAETVSGGLHSDLPPRAGDRPPREDAPRVQVRTISGGIRLSRYLG